MKVLIVILAVGIFIPIQHAVGQHQGIRGEVLWFSGNQMPGPGKEFDPKMGVKREIAIHKITTLSQTKQDGIFFSAINTELVATITTEENGSFRVKLPPGEYSLFVKEPGGYYANLFNDKGQINPVKVEPNRFSWITITIDYEAVY